MLDLLGGCAPRRLHLHRVTVVLGMPRSGQEDLGSGCGYGGLDESRVVAGCWVGGLDPSLRQALLIQAFSLGWPLFGDPYQATFGDPDATKFRSHSWES